MADSTLASEPVNLSRKFAWVAGIVGLTLLTLWPVVTHGFTDWDDSHNVWLNPDFNPPTAAKVLSYWRKPLADLYIPLTYSTWGLASMFAWSRTGLDPHVFHGLNLLVHLGSAVIVFLILDTLGFPPLAAGLSAALFAVHPVQVESVAWVSGLKDLLCGAFSLLAIYSYVRARTGMSPRPFQALMLATLAFALALLAKPSAVVVPVMVVLIDIAFVRRPVRPIAPWLSAWMLMGIAIAVVTKIIQPAELSQTLSPLWARPFIAADALTFYLSKLAVPIHLVVDYGRSPDKILSSKIIYASASIGLAFVAAVLIGFRRFPRLSAGAAIFLAGLFPVLGFVPFSFQFYSTVADHYLYLPMFGVAVFAARIIERIPVRPSLVAGTVVVLALSIQSWRQSWVWRDTITLFTHNLSVNDRSIAAHPNLAVAYLNRGDWAGAMKHGEIATQLRPDDPNARLNYALALRSGGQLESSIVQFREAEKLSPRDPIIPMVLGSALAELGQYAPAVEALERAVALAPASREAAQRLAAVRAAQQHAPTTTSPVQQ